MISKEEIAALCGRMTNDCADWIEDATIHITGMCNLTADQTTDVAIILSGMTRDIVKRTLDLAIQLAAEESRRAEQEEV